MRRAVCLLLTLLLRREVHRRGGYPLPADRDEAVARAQAAPVP